MRRFRGTLIGLFVLGALLVFGWWLERPLPDDAVALEVFRFEKSDLVGFQVRWPDRSLEVREVGGTWTVTGESWRPSRAMIRRVAHQLHDLDARAVLADPGPLEQYGLGAGAIRVTLTLRDGRALAFDVGDPNPTAVSWYMRPLPGDRVFVVKKSAMDLYRLDLESFREDRIASFDADDAVRIDASTARGELRLEQVAPRRYRMLAPIVQDADADGVRGLLGRAAALRATSFVADQPADLHPYGLQPPAATLRITLATGATLTLWLGDPVPGRDPPERYLWLDEDHAVYAVRDGLLEELARDPADLRDRDLLHRRTDELVGLSARCGGDTVELVRGADRWRRPDGRAVPGSTPERLAAALAGARAAVFLAPAADDGLSPPECTVGVETSDGARVQLALGRRWTTERPPPPPGAPVGPGRDPHVLVRVDGVDGVVRLDSHLAELVDDLLREQRRLDATPEPE